MKTNFNQKSIKVMVRENGGNKEYSYNYFKKGFEEWAEDYDASLPDTDQLKEYVIGCGYNVIEIIEL